MLFEDAKILLELLNVALQELFFVHIKVILSNQTLKLSVVKVVIGILPSKVYLVPNEEGRSCH